MSLQLQHEAYSLDSQQTQLFWWDDFLGDQIQDEWSTGTGGTGTIGVIGGVAGGAVKFNCPANADTASARQGIIRCFLASKNAAVEYNYLLNVINTDTYFELALYYDANEHILLRNTGVNLFYRTRAAGSDAGSNFTIATPLLAAAFYQARMQFHNIASHAHIYISNSELANSPLSLNITAQYLDLFLYALNINPGAGGAFYTYLDYVGVRQDI